MTERGKAPERGEAERATCMHQHEGGQNVAPVFCGKPAKFTVPLLTQTVAGHSVPLQVCGLHANFWAARGFKTEPRAPSRHIRERCVTK